MTDARRPIAGGADPVARQDSRSGATMARAKVRKVAPSGSCATCMAKLTEGEATMRTNNALTPELSTDEKRKLLERLTEVDGLERFIGRAFVNAKRFSIEGVDALVPVIDEALAKSGKHGTKAAVIGMAHRGRLNVLAHALRKPYSTIFREFAGRHDHTNAASGTGDVKYHLGYRTEREFHNGARIDTLLVPSNQEEYLPEIEDPQLDMVVEDLHGLGQVSEEPFHVCKFGFLHDRHDARGVQEGARLPGGLQ